MHTHFIHIHTNDTLRASDAPLNFDLDDDFVFETTIEPNPMDSDDPEVAYHEYLAQRFSVGGAR